MKFLVTVAALFLSSVCFAQSSLTGKWKPVFVSVEGLLRGDVKADTLFIPPSLEENFKGDKDPEASRKIMKFLAEALFEKMKETQEEYFADGKYTELNTRTGRSKEGTYSFDEKDNKLERQRPPVNKKEKFTVSWRNDQLILTGELESENGKKGKIEVVYERS